MKIKLKILCYIEEQFYKLLHPVLENFKFKSQIASWVLLPYYLKTDYRETTLNPYWLILVLKKS